MDQHRFGLSPEDDQPIDPASVSADPPPGGEPLSTTPPEAQADPPPPPASAEPGPVADSGSVEPSAAELEPPNAPPAATSAAGPSDEAGGGEPPRPPVPFFTGLADPPPAPAGASVASDAGELATYGSRVVGFLVDFMLLLVGLIAVRIIVAALPSGTGSSLFFAYVVAGPYTYAWLMIGRTGQTVGMRVAKVRCVMANGTELSMPRAAGRAAMATVFGIVPYFLGNALDLLFPAWDKQRQTLHDKVVGTVVVKVPAVPDLPPPAA